MRYISNRSSGKMGYALAQAATREGAEVTLVSGPVALAPPPVARFIAVETADEMFNAVMQHAAKSDIFIACAAVSDYRVDEVAAHKIKKESDTLTLKLVRNPDILATVSALASGRPFCVGFAAETRQMEEYARDKLEQKKLDLIAANLVGGEGSGFESEQNRLEVFWNDGRHEIERASKAEVAKQLMDLIAERYTSARS